MIPSRKSNLVGLLAIATLACSNKTNTGSTAGAYNKPASAGTIGPVPGGNDVPGPPTANSAANTGTPRLRLGFGPPDLSTAIGATQLEIRLADSGPVSAALMQEVADGVSLVSWPGGQEVSATKDIYIPTGAPDQDGFARVKVRPAQPLASTGWYALRLQPLKNQLFQLDPNALDHVVANAVAVSRFSVGENPIAVSVREVRKGAGPVMTMVDFSERIDGAGQARGLSLRTRRGDPLDCLVQPWPPTESALSVVFTCSRSVIDDLSVEVGAGLRSAAGKEVKGARIELGSVVTFPDGQRFSKLQASIP